MAAAAFGEEGVFGVQFHALLVGVGGLAVLADAHVAGGHTLDRTVLVVEHFGGGEAGEYFDTRSLRLLAQPAHHVTQADDIVAVVLKTLRQHEGRDTVR